MVSRRSRSQEYKQEIAPFLEEWAGRGLAPWEQFRNWSVQQILWEYNLSIPDIEDAVSTDGPRDQGIDAWYYDDSDEISRLILVQGKDTQLKRDDFSKLKDGSLDLMLPDRPGRANRSLREKAASFRDTMPEHFNLDVYLTSSVLAQQNLQGREDSSPLYTEVFSIGENSVNASFYVRDIKHLVDNLKVIHSEPIGCTFTLDGGSLINFLVGGHTRTVCAALKATELADLFDRQRENLFRKNPRYYLLMTARNKDISTSLKEDQNADFSSIIMA